MWMVFIEACTAQNFSSQPLGKSAGAGMCVGEMGLHGICHGLGCASGVVAAIAWRSKNTKKWGLGTFCPSFFWWL